MPYQTKKWYAGFCERVCGLKNDRFFLINFTWYFLVTFLKSKTPQKNATQVDACTTYTKIVVACPCFVVVNRQSVNWAANGLVFLKIKT